MILRAGIVGSSGGSALRAAAECLSAVGIRLELTVLVDRPCGLQAWAESAGHRTAFIPYANASSFSFVARDAFASASCDHVLLYYTRRVSAPLITHCQVHNIHPSLLPDFAGLHGVRDAVNAKSRVLGATLHEVDAKLDNGPISAQVACALEEGTSLERAERLSYLQKVYLTLVWFELVQNGFVNGAPGNADHGIAISTASAGLLTANLLDAYRQWVSKTEGASPFVRGIAA